MGGGGGGDSPLLPKVLVSLPPEGGLQHFCRECQFPSGFALLGFVF